jgi:hypothetical protein
VEFARVKCISYLTRAINSVAEMLGSCLSIDILAEPEDIWAVAEAVQFLKSAMFSTPVTGSNIRIQGRQARKKG